jgi:hypothetical protein
MFVDQYREERNAMWLGALQSARRLVHCWISLRRCWSLPVSAQKVDGDSLEIGGGRIDCTVSTRRAGPNLRRRLAGRCCGGGISKR